MERQHLFCPKCGNVNRLEARFCIGCGAKIGLACNTCGYMNRTEAIFCLMCGARLKDQTPLDKIIGQFKKYAYRQSMVVTLQEVTEHTLHYIDRELRRLGLSPLLIHYSPQKEISLTSLLDCVLRSTGFRQMVSSKVQKSADKILDLLSKGVDFTLDEIINLLDEYFLELRCKSKPVVLSYCPYIPLSYSAWRFVRDYTRIIRCVSIPWLTITHSLLLPLYLGDSRLLTADSTEAIYLEFTKGDAERVVEYDHLSINRITDRFDDIIHFYDFSTDNVRHVRSEVNLFNRQLSVYRDFFGKGYVIACLHPQWCIQLTLHRFLEASAVSKWKRLIPEWERIPGRVWRKLNRIAGLGTLEAFTGRIYEIKDELPLYSHFAFIPAHSIVYLRILDSDYFLRV